MWCDKNFQDKRKLRYYKEVANLDLEDQQYLLVLRSEKKKINISKIRTNSHWLHSVARIWTISKTKWDEIISHHFDTKRVEDENHFLYISLPIVIIDPNLTIFTTMHTFLTS